ncbi:MAG: hypothetical protein ACLGII_03805 [Gammaproteobacteria bacterium]
MSAGGNPHDGSLAARKAALVAASARARQDLRGQLSARAVRDTPTARLVSTAGSFLREPLVLGVLAVGLLAIGPRRLFRLVRWGAVVLPLHPLGRRLIPVIGARLLAVLDERPRPRGR